LNVGFRAYGGGPDVDISNKDDYEVRCGDYPFLSYDVVCYFADEYGNIMETIYE